MSISLRPLPGTTRDPLYPDSDGEPMGETDYHVLALVYLFDALRDWFRKQENVYVAGDMLLYYEEGNPKARRGPDVMIAKGVVGKHKRRSFRTWEEGVPPTVIIEVTSKKTRREDEFEKPPVYASIGVKELILFDPEGDWLRPRLQAYQLKRGKYVLMAADATGQIFSPELGLTIAIEEHLPRLIDPTGTPLPTRDELVDEIRETRREARNAKRRASRAERAARAARIEVDEAKQKAAALEAELAKLRGSSPPNHQNHK